MLDEKKGSVSSKLGELFKDTCMESSGSKMASFGHIGFRSRSFHRLSTVMAMEFVLTVFVLLTVKVYSSEADDISKQEPAFFDQFYAEGVKAYTDQLWYKCAHNLEKALEDYKTLKKTLTDCRLRCKKNDPETESEELSELTSDVGDLSMFKTFLNHALCFRTCKGDAYKTRPGLTVTKTVEKTFESLKPYQYLQYCWYKLDRVKQAASASYTYYLKNPEDEDVKKNIAFYRDRAKVPESDFIDLELVPYKEHYIRAMLAYNEEDWPKVTDYLEKAIKEFLVEEERCRADCEDNLDTTSASHFSGVIADHFMKVLECQLGCEGNLSIIYTEPEEGFFAQQFHFLQYAYYKTDKIAEAVEATASFLLFRPDDEVMLENKKVFMKKFKYDDEQFVPRQDAQMYVERRKKMQALFDYLQEHFIPEVPDVIFVTEADAEPEPLSREASENPTTDHLTWMERYERLGLHLVAKETDLHRPFRFAADGLLKQEQCEDILTLMEDVPVDKKGAQIFTLAQGRESAPMKDENYEASLRLFIRASEVMRHYTQRYYNMSGSLFFKKAIMVCWRQVPDPEVEHDCIPQEFGTCDPEANIKERELVQDHFVTVTYLNSIEDADVFFLGENISVDTSLGVKPGRTVGFQSGDRHGLHIPASVASPRCAMVITYTTFPTEDERDYTDTVAVLQRLEEIRMEKGLRSRQEVMRKFEEMGVHVIKNSTDLHGGERFAADGLASDAECVSLKNIVMSGALIGDGYDRLESKPSFISPHTENELYQGLTIYRASKLMHSGVVNTFALKTFLDLSEKSRLYVEKYFNLSRPLYFDFTHLVCRTPIDESKERDDLSHPVHSDNCIMQPDGSCLKQYPAYVQRDYSALLYLNDDIKGGEFFFAYPNKSEQVSIKPRCGRLVGFNASEYHGVKAVKGGTRCALAMWFTMNPSFKELAHIHARKVLRSAQAQSDRQEKESADAAAGGGGDGDNSAAVTEAEVQAQSDRQEKESADADAAAGGGGDGDNSAAVTEAEVQAQEDHKEKESAVTGDSADAAVGGDDDSVADSASDGDSDSRAASAAAKESEVRAASSSSSAAEEEVAAVKGETGERGDKNDDDDEDRDEL
ncbi:prolyl 3-hydroxylase 1-like isoform X2 [Babylonia areolata]|uniref:prolyl 3-hydroxylase 1-like isoform X2 n=1 Tax=Babylonia areolata TaxID=304850 RepID=UPI003FD4B7B2